MKKEIEKAFAKVGILEEKARKDIADTRTEIENLTRDITNENTKMDNALVLGDYESYEISKKSIEEARERMEMLKKRYELLKSSGGATYEDGIEFMNLIHSLQDKELEDAAKKLQPLFAEARKIIDDALSSIADGNNALSDWHNRIRKFSPTKDETTTERSELFYLQEVYYKRADALCYCKETMSHGAFYKAAGEDAPAPIFNTSRLI